MSVNSFISNYFRMSETQGSAAGNGGAVELSYENGILLFTESDGDTHSVNAQSLSDEDLNEIAAQVGATIKGAEAPEETKEDATLEANKQRMEDLNGQYDGLNKTATSIKETVEKLSTEIEEELKKALDKSEKATEQEKARIEEFTKEQIAQFKADKEAGKPVTVDDLNNSIQEGMSQGGYDAEITAVVSGLITTNAKMTQMDVMLDELSVINGQMRMLDTEMTSLAQTIKTQEEAAKAAEAAAASSNCCDPIGFKDKDTGYTYEFVIDTDGNGELSNFSEFLGAEGNYEALMNLDGNVDGQTDNKVSKEELEKAGVKVIVKDANGNQVQGENGGLMSLDEAFNGQDINIDLANMATYDGQGKVAENGQELLANFDITIGDDDKEVGYSTLDSEDYLLNNYTFTDQDPTQAVAGAANSAEEVDADLLAAQEERAKDINANNTFIVEYSEKLELFEQQYATLLENLDLSEELVDSIKEYSQAAGAASAEKIMNEFEAKEAEEAEKAEEEQEAKEAEEAENEEADEENNQEAA